MVHGPRFKRRYTYTKITASHVTRHISSEWVVSELFQLSSSLMTMIMMMMMMMMMLNVTMNLCSLHFAWGAVCFRPNHVNWRLFHVNFVTSNY